MLIKLRELNGTYYMLIKKELKEMMGIDDYVDATLENGKIVVSKVVDNIVDKVENF
jgi:uncharacterized protein YlzI (FlbEa/FlbD family)